MEIDQLSAQIINRFGYSKANEDECAALKNAVRLDQISTLTDSRAKRTAGFAKSIANHYTTPVQEGFRVPLDLQSNKTLSNIAITRFEAINSLHSPSIHKQIINGIYTAILTPSLVLKKILSQHNAHQNEAIEQGLKLIKEMSKIPLFLFNEFLKFLTNQPNGTVGADNEISKDFFQLNPNGLITITNKIVDDFFNYIQQRIASGAIISEDLEVSKQNKIYGCPALYANVTVNEKEMDFIEAIYRLIVLDIEREKPE